MLLEITTLGASGYVAMVAVWFGILRPASLSWVRQRRIVRDE